MTQTTKTKIVLLLFVPIVNHFSFPSPNEEYHFFDLAEVRKKWLLEERKGSNFSKEQWLELFATDYTSKIEEVINQKTSTKAVIINYPSNEKNFDSFHQMLTKQGMKIDRVILIAITNYELILNLKIKYLICPLCEKIVKREEAIRSSNNQSKFFVCPKDKECQFSLAEIEQINEWIIEYYLSSTKKTVEKFSKEKIVLTQFTVKQLEDVFSEKIQVEIMKIIESL